MKKDDKFVAKEENFMIFKVPLVESLQFIKAYTKRIEKTNGKTILKYINNKIPNKPGIYFLYNKKGDLLYIGQTENISRRISCHRKRLSPYKIRFFICDKDSYFRIGIEHLLISMCRPLFQRN